MKEDITEDLQPSAPESETEEEIVEDSSDESE